MNSIAIAVTLVLCAAVTVACTGIPGPSPQNGAKYVLAPGPYVKEDLGSPIQSATLSSSILFKHPVSNQAHFIFLYYLFSGGDKTPYQILDLNLDTGQVRLVDGGFGRPDPAPMVVYPHNGKVYIPSQGPGYLTSYDPISGQAKVIRRLADRGAQALTIGDDLALYIGEATRGYVERYDPVKDPDEVGAAQSWTNLGILDDPGPPHYRYVYTHASDGHFLYAAILDNYADPKWRFVVKEIRTGREKVYWTDIKARYIEALASHRGNGVGCYTLEEQTPQCFEFEGFSQVASVDRKHFRGNLNRKMLPTLNPVGYAVDTQQNRPDSSNGGSAVIRWKRPNDDMWREAMVKGIRMEDVGLMRVFPFSDSKLLGFGRAYSPQFLFDTTTQRTTVLGRPVLSPYDALYSRVHKKWYVAGYPRAWQEYDPGKPWTLGRVRDFQSDVNPHFLPVPSEPELAGMWYYYIAEDRDGVIYLGSHHERESAGSSLIWLDPASRSTASAARAWAGPSQSGEYGALRLPFSKREIRGLTAALDGSKIVVSAAICCGERGDSAGLYVIDIGQKKIEREIVPLPGILDAGPIIEVQPGIVAGSVGKVLYRVDIRSGHVLGLREAPDVVFGSVPAYQSYQRRWALGPDGFLWAYIGDTDIYRINPSNLDLEKVIYYPPASPIIFHGGMMYLAGNGPLLRRVVNLFTTSMDGE